MRRIHGVLMVSSLVLALASCSSKVSRSGLVPFTNDLKVKLETENIDLKEVQFYVDQKIILNRNLGDQKVKISSGVIKQENGKFINEVVIPAFTPGVCIGQMGDKIMVSFEKGNNALPFGPGSGYTFNDFSLYGVEWKNGTAAVMYDANKFRARCGSCSDIASVTLLIKKKVKEKVEHKSRTLKGRTVKN